MRASGGPLRGAPAKASWRGISFRHLSQASYDEGITYLKACATLRGLAGNLWDRHGAVFVRLIAIEADEILTPQRRRTLQLGNDESIAATFASETDLARAGYVLRCLSTLRRWNKKGSTRRSITRTIDRWIRAGARYGESLPPGELRRIQRSWERDVRPPGEPVLISDGEEILYLGRRAPYIAPAAEGDERWEADLLTLLVHAETAMGKVRRTTGPVRIPEEQVAQSVRGTSLPSRARGLLPYGVLSFLAGTS